VPRLVLTVIGDDRAGLVSALADVVSTHDGNWEDSQLAHLAGTFAGIVVVSVPAERVEALTTALRSLDGRLQVTSHPASEAESASAGSGAPDGSGEGPGGESDAPQRLTIDLLGNDHPGIVREVSSVLSGHDVSIETMTTGTREAPMAGGLLFEAHLVALLPSSVATSELSADLERLAGELLVDIALA
jgi:glycine cleavage system regulatory protein